MTTSSTQPTPPAGPSAGTLGAVARGEADAFRRALDAFGPIVWGVARTYCTNPADAEDATQEAFLKIWRVARQYDPGRGSESAFVVTVARRTVLDFRRGSRRAAATIVRGAELKPPSPPAPGPAADETRRARDAMATLPVEQQEALRLAVQGGLTQETIASSLGLPLGTVKTRIRSALIRLRDTLDADRRPRAISGSEATP